MADTKLAALPSTGERNSVNDVLHDAIDDNYDEVFVFGLKDGEIHIKHSRIGSTLKTMGALEAAKIGLWEER